MAPQCFPSGSHVLDSTTGTQCVASGSRFSSAVQGQLDGVNAYWITIGQKGVRCSINGDGDRLGKADFVSKNGIVESAHVVHKHSKGVCHQRTPPNLMPLPRVLYRWCLYGQGSTACLFSPTSRTHVHSARDHLFAQVCENVVLSNCYLPPGCYRTLSIDESGDYIDWTIRDDVAHKCELGTLFGLRRKTLYHDKVLDIIRDRNRLPAQPQPVSMGPATLLGQMYAFVGGNSTTGAQIDALRKYNTLRFPAARLGS